MTLMPFERITEKASLMKVDFLPDMNMIRFYPVV